MHLEWCPEICIWTSILRLLIQMGRRGILWETLKVNFFSLCVDPGISLLGIYYKEILQNITLALNPKSVTGSLLILAKNWNCSIYPPTWQNLSKLHTASAWWNIIQMFKRMLARFLYQHGKYKWKKLRFKVV